MDDEQIILATRLVENWKESLTQRFILDFYPKVKFNFPNSTWTIINEDQTYIEKNDPQLIAYLKY